MALSPLVLRRPLGGFFRAPVFLFFVLGVCQAAHPAPVPGYAYHFPPSGGYVDIQADGGAKGDGVTDDTEALKAIFEAGPGQSHPDFSSSRTTEERFLYSEADIEEYRSRMSGAGPFFSRGDAGHGGQWSPNDGERSEELAAEFLNNPREAYWSQPDLPYASGDPYPPHRTRFAGPMHAAWIYMTQPEHPDRETLFDAWAMSRYVTDDWERRNRGEPLTLDHFYHDVIPAAIAHRLAEEYHYEVNSEKRKSTG